MHPDIFPPKHVDIDRANQEIRYLQEQVFKAREALAACIIEREKDKRAAKGNIKALSEENQELRNRIKKYVEQNQKKNNS